MTRFSTAIAACALLALGACGGGGTETAANNSAEATATEDLTLPPDENAAAGAAGGDTLGNQLNALETTNALGNQVTENGTGNTAASGDNLSAGNTAGNSTANSQ